MCLVSFPDAEEIVDRFIELLDDLSITPPAGTGIESDFLSVTELLSLMTAGARRAKPELLAQAGGMLDLAAKLLSISNQPEFSTFRPHLELFSSKIPIATAVQSTPGANTDDVHRKLNELYLGSIAVHVGTNVELDHPGASAGDNPDVLFDCQRDGMPMRRWALAIKTVSSRSGQTIFDRIAEGSRQINAPACRAHRGFVVVSVQGSIDHQALWSRTFSDEQEGISALKSQIDRWAEAARRDRPSAEWTAALSGKTAPQVLYMGHAVVRIQTRGGPEIPTVLKMLCADTPTPGADAEAMSIAGLMNEFMQSIRRGVCGGPGRLPG